MDAKHITTKQRALENRGYKLMIETPEEYCYVGIERDYIVVNITINRVTGEMKVKI